MISRMNGDYTKNDNIFPFPDIARKNSIQSRPNGVVVYAAVAFIDVAIVVVVVVVIAVFFTVIVGFIVVVVAVVVVVIAVDATLLSQSLSPSNQYYSFFPFPLYLQNSFHYNLRMYKVSLHKVGRISQINALHAIMVGVAKPADSVTTYSVLSLQHKMTQIHKI